jgi:hypothetical protein
MPSEHDDAQIRQLEALRRYVAELGTQRERPTELGMQRERLTVDGAPTPTEPANRRPSPRWLLLTGLLVTVALIGGVFLGAVGWSDERPARRQAGAVGDAPATQLPETSTAAPVATPACKTAVDLANSMLASAVRLRGALAEHDRILDDPASRTLSGRELLDKLSPSMRVVSGDAAKFDRALADYRQVVDQCEVRAP